MKTLLEAGKIINTHGLKGELKIQSWCDSPEFFMSIPVLYIDEIPYKVISVRVHKNDVLAFLSGIDSIEKSERLKGKTVYLNRNDVKLPEKSCFIQDLIGCDVFDQRQNKVIGKLYGVSSFPAHDVYVVDEKKQYMIPAIPEFVKEIDLKQRTIYIRSIEGMADDED